MRKIAIIIPALLILLTGCNGGDNKNTGGTTNPQTGGKIAAKWVMKKGEVRKLKTVTDMKISQTVQNVKQDISQQIGQTLSYEATDVDASGNTLISVTFVAMSFNQRTSDGVNLSIDTSTGDVNDNSASQIYSAIIGESFTMKVSPTGQVLELQGVPKLLNNIAQKMNIQSSLKESFIDSLKEQYGDDAMKSMMAQSFGYFPTTSVSVGDQWKTTLALAGSFPMMIDSTFTLKENKDGNLKIDFVSTLSSNASVTMVSGNVTLVPILKSGKQSGSIVISDSTGWIKSGKVIQDFQMDTQLVGQDEGGAAQVIPMTVSSVITYESVE